MDKNLGKMLQSSRGAGGEHYSHDTGVAAAAGGEDCPAKERRGGKKESSFHLNTCTSISWEKEQGVVQGERWPLLMLEP